HHSLAIAKEAGLKHGWVKNATATARLRPGQDCVGTTGWSPKSPGEGVPPYRFAKERNKTEIRISKSETNLNRQNQNSKSETVPCRIFCSFEHLNLFRISDPSTSLRTGFEFGI